MTFRRTERDEPHEDMGSGCIGTSRQFQAAEWSFHKGRPILGFTARCKLFQVYAQAAAACQKWSVMSQARLKREEDFGTEEIAPSSRKGERTTRPVCWACDR